MSNIGSGALHEWHFPVPPAQAFEALSQSVASLFNLKDSDDFAMTVQFMTKASALTWGDRCIAQVIKDGDDSKIRITSASRNADSSLVAGKLEQNMQRLIKDVSQRLRDAAPAAPKATPAAVSSSNDIASKIRQLGELKDQGLITQEEFDAKKTDLLNQM